MEEYYEKLGGVNIQNIKNEFYEQLNEVIEKKNWSTFLTNNDYSKLMEEYKVAKDKLTKKTSHEYYLLKHYDLIKIGDEEKLVHKIKHVEDVPIIIATKEMLFDILLKSHLDTGHGRRDKMLHDIKSSYHGVTVDIIRLFLNLCKECATIKARKAITGIVVKPIISDYFDSRMQIDLIDMQSCKDGEYQWILNAQNHFTKFCHLKPLKSKRAAEVAVRVFEIFVDFGAPVILQSDNGREFESLLMYNL